jgi:hypothetical protein
VLDLERLRERAHDRPRRELRPRLVFRPRIVGRLPKKYVYVVCAVCVPCMSCAVREVRRVKTLICRGRVGHDSDGVLGASAD